MNTYRRISLKTLLDGILGGFVEEPRDRTGETIARLAAANLSLRQIARRCGHDHKFVRRRLQKSRAA